MLFLILYSNYSYFDHFGNSKHSYSYDQFPAANPQFDLASKNEEGPVDPEKGHNGHQCWQCKDVNYADCQTNGKIVNCKSEQFHCNIRENRQFGLVTKVNMGTLQFPLGGSTEHYWF